ncbi:type II toxin-antitoxin system death-on-curing family toxin [Enterococcus lactis]|uniref:type II toxin-antitoxin system death-on-curing family toxin n=1 Tax=Enterococcus faecium TaxID=1352 RepID=UPI00064C7D6E|nr:type II toxin-antitoxin system death-on-curing family toxin [Enterococcus faecium]PWF38754.1 type II toxin-antitoxin system death-on-curing family toxin [Enterococcus faecium]WJW77099.1 type II toxin-antitoxin system death-on-curing family toxin [Enterococcus faecium]
MSKYVYFNVNHAIITHDMLIEKTGGLNGIKERGLLESSLGHIQIDDYYPTFEEKLLHLIFSIAQNHVFVDGNKRTAISLGAYFLLINGYPSWIVGDFIEKMEDIVLLLVEKLLTKEECGEYMALIISENPFPELLQMKLISSLIELKRLEEERT